MKMLIVTILMALAMAVIFGLVAVLVLPPEIPDEDTNPSWFAPHGGDL